MPIFVYEKGKGKGRKVSDNFHSNEFDCPCDSCKMTLVSTELVARLEVIRELLGTPIKITSGYRCNDYQQQLKLRGYETAKGVSQHELGKAADITNGVALGIELEELASKAGFTSIGVGKHFVHLDMRPEERRWKYSY